MFIIIYGSLRLKSNYCVTEIGFLFFCINCKARREAKPHKMKKTSYFSQYIKEIKFSIVLNMEKQIHIVQIKMREVIVHNYIYN